MWWKIRFHHPRKVLSLHCTQKPNITKKILLPTRKQTKVVVGKWKNGIFQCMVMSMSLFIYLFIYSHQHLSTILSFFISFVWTYSLYRYVQMQFIPKKKRRKCITAFLFFPPQKNLFFPSSPSLYSFLLLLYSICIPKNIYL